MPQPNARFGSDNSVYCPLDSCPSVVLTSAAWTDPWSSAWYCCGLILQFRIGTVVVGDSVNFRGGIDWLRELGITVIDLASSECVRMLADYIARRARPEA